MNGGEYWIKVDECSLNTNLKRTLKVGHSQKGLPIFNSYLRQWHYLNGQLKPRVALNKSLIN